jgi:hypothetical protein
MTIEYTPEGKAHILECMLDPKDRDYNLWHYSKTDPDYPYNLRTDNLDNWLSNHCILQISGSSYKIIKLEVYSKKHECLLATVTPE